MDFHESSQIMKNALSAMSDAAFQQAGSMLSECKNSIREKLQAETAPDVKNIMKKLTADQPLSTSEINLIRLWIIGDAESYTMTENNFPEWINECERLEEILSGYANKNCTAEDLFKLQGILTDAVRVCYDIANFLEQKERIKKFESAISDGLDQDEREALVKALAGKLQSAQY